MILHDHYFRLLDLADESTMHELQKAILKDPNTLLILGVPVTKDTTYRDVFDAMSNKIKEQVTVLNVEDLERKLRQYRNGMFLELEKNNIIFQHAKPFYENLKNTPDDMPVYVLFELTNRLEETTK